MKDRATAIKLSLGALALWVGVAAQAAAPIITNITMVGATPRFGVQSDLGITNQIQSCTNLSQTNWLVLTNLLVAQSPYYFADVTAPPAPRRFYRVMSFATNSAPPDGMALIPAGSFTMGNCMTPDEGYSDELPLHTVNVSAFYMDRYEVTKALWDEVYQWATNRPAAVRYSFDDAGSGKATTHPVQTIDWYDCVKWCNARSEKEGRTPCYYTNASLGQTAIYRSGRFDLATNWVSWVGNGYRLPTEAEWEKAARGGASGHRFPWADADTITWSRANYYSYWSDGHPYDAYDVNPTEGYNPAWTSGGTPYTTPVGSFAANGYGLYDMAGNVWEWCWDWYGSYSSGSQTDPRGPASGSSRVDRGGCWSGSAGFCRAAGRSHNTPGFWYYSVGFRSVLPPGQ
jgi:formylglycine-generating enzyme required for sulfatase activity